MRLGGNSSRFGKRLLESRLSCWGAMVAVGVCLDHITAEIGDVSSVQQFAFDDALAGLGADTACPMIAFASALERDDLGSMNRRDLRNRPLSR